MLTVIITTYNSERTLHQCLDSILKPNLDFISEIIVCDDCSSDRTLKILDRVINGPLQGHYWVIQGSLQGYSWIIIGPS